MKVTYIGHSGFLIELNNSNWLIDYYEGRIPAMDPAKPLYVLASHRHQDHFNPDIFTLAKLCENITFVLSYDIKLNAFKKGKYGITPEIEKRIQTVRFRESYDLAEGIRLVTFKSTDEGVAFLIEGEGQTIYHAGDLNWWSWDDGDDAFNSNMKSLFLREVELIMSYNIDIAFLPLDSRQGPFYYQGMEYMMEKVAMKKVFPMHMFGDMTVQDRFMKERHTQNDKIQLMHIDRVGQEFFL